MVMLWGYQNLGETPKLQQKCILPAVKMLVSRLTREVHETQVSDRKNALSLVARCLWKAHCGVVVTLEKQLNLTTDS